MLFGFSEPPRLILEIQKSELYTAAARAPPRHDQRSWCQWQRDNVSEHTYPVPSTYYRTCTDVNCTVQYVCNVTQIKMWCDTHTHRHFSVRAVLREEITECMPFFHLLLECMFYRLECMSLSVWPSLSRHLVYAFGHHERRPPWWLTAPRCNLNASRTDSCNI